MEGGEDRISVLPEVIIHKIMDYLPTKALVQTCTLSKTWYTLQQSYPCLHFNLDDFSSSGFEHFGESVYNSLNRFQGKGLSLQRVEIIVDQDEGVGHVDSNELCKHAPSWIELALDVGVKELVVYLGHKSYTFDFWPVSNFTKCYSRTLACLSVAGFILEKPVSNFPQCYSKTLACLSVAGFILEKPVSSIFGKFESLAKLVLYNCEIKGSAVLKLTTHFPLLENLDIIDCFGFESVSVSNLTRMKNLKVLAWGGRPVSIEVAAPSLEILCLESKTISMCGCHNLTFLLLHDVVLSEKELYCILSELPVLENLSLVGCCCQVVKICSQRLKTLILEDSFVMTIELVTPSLNTFILGCGDGDWPLINIVDRHCLNNLLLHHTRITDQELLDFISELPQLEYLWISECSELERVKISGQNLKRLCITGGLMLKLESIEVDTPNLCSFCVTNIPISSSSIVVRQPAVRFEERCRSEEAFWAGKLGEMLHFYLEVSDAAVIDILTSILLEMVCGDVSWDFFECNPGIYIHTSSGGFNYELGRRTKYQVSSNKQQGGRGFNGGKLKWCSET
ncbi:hypothetical protein SLEP1_g51760 [Rubroshorea leprosula]|uniref:F-box domain-containing protein n=1 Tax=Rubroshorea leprosula TaxID=152421 RepID=A0AAV5M4D6_9ROSI|nr:hypothetical protein SLEP1_g51760 [Rubroshorea leprosula]